MTLIVLAHPESRSFNCDWARATGAACADAGESVLWSDLYAMGFDPAERNSHYDIPGPFDPLKAQEQAAAAGTLPAHVNAEVAKIRQADRIVLHFPLWWFGPPAMLKGWCDRCLAHGALHTTDQRFDTGMARGKSVLFCVSTGSSALESGPHGKEGDVRMLLWPLAYTFRYLGYDVLDPVTEHGVHGYHSGAKEAALRSRLDHRLKSQAQLIAGWDSHPRTDFNADSDFDDTGQLKRGTAQQTPFIRPLP